MTGEFDFGVKGEGPQAEALRLLLHLRATADALSALVVETAAKVSAADVREVQTRFEELRQNALFRLANELQDRAAGQAERPAQGADGGGQVKAARGG